MEEGQREGGGEKTREERRRNMDRIKCMRTKIE